MSHQKENIRETTSAVVLQRQKEAKRLIATAKSNTTRGKKFASPAERALQLVAEAKGIKRAADEVNAMVHRAKVYSPCHFCIHAATLS